MNRRTIEVVNFDPSWAIQFESIRVQLKEAIGVTALKIEHVGSTSVPRLAAKPVIDILIEVVSLEELDKRNKSIGSLGFVAKGEGGIVGRRYFQKGGNQRTHHAHAFKEGDKNLIRHRAFKEYLIAKPEIADHYGALKKEAARNCQNDRVKYMSMKNDFIQKHEELALLWYRN